MKLTFDVEDEQLGLRRYQVCVARLTDHPRLEVLPANFRKRQVVNRYPGLLVVVIGVVYHAVVEIPRQLRRRSAAPHLANQVHVATLVVPLLDAPNVPRRAVQYYRLRRRHCANTGHRASLERRGIGRESIDRTPKRTATQYERGRMDRAASCGRHRGWNLRATLPLQQN